jgi:hypothetical protein
MKIFNIVFIILFVLFATLQYNDPDPYIWIPIYLFAAYLCYQAIKRRYQPFLYTIGFVVYISYAVYLVFEKSGVINWATAHNTESLVQTMKAEKPWIEATREFGGLVIILFVLLINMFYLRKPRNANPSYNLPLI